MVIRAFQQQDAEALARLFRHTGNTLALTPTSNNNHQVGLLVLEHQGDLLGAAHYRQSQKPAGKYWVTVEVLAHANDHATLKTFYHGIIDTLWPLSASMLYTFAPQEQPAFSQALEDLGFTFEMESFAARLDVQSFDESRFAAYQNRLRGTFDIVTLKLLEQRAHVHTTLFELYQQVYPDIPELGFQQKLDYARFKRDYFEALGSNPKCFFVALSEGEIAGFSQHFVHSNSLEMGLTLVKPEVRRRGLAMLMKLAGIAYAKANHIPSITTTLATNNMPMLTLDTRLGFKSSKGFTTYVKLL